MVVGRHGEINVLKACKIIKILQNKKTHTSQRIFFLICYDFDVFIYNIAFVYYDYDVPCGLACGNILIKRRGIQIVIFVIG